MLIIHQRKSAGTSLLYTLSSLLGVKIASYPKYNTYKDKQKRFSYFESLVDAKAPIISYHLHPTLDNYNWVVNNRIKCVILLRNPEKSFEAMSRHLSVDGKMVGPNRGSSKDVLYEFYNNWLSLKDLDHVCMVFFENLIKNDRLVIQEILDFYGIRLKEKNLRLQKKRYTGVGLMQNVDLKTTPMSYGPPTFNHNPHRRTVIDIVSALYYRFAPKYLSTLLKKIPGLKRVLKKIILK